ncbi:TetR family transcriptional regulator [Mycolicibacterium conceptionense]|jgi:AcrR family transcriptional regulator|uniref:TetR family transcriptional regulator n=2 Tax=Mycolicibacterium TaxID=1866885 RepID=A0ABR5FUU3_9MYCO|nr:MULTISPECIES: TetR/AcrR family transcriptional regulator [Mycolicibacterium]KLI09683.1 TetR family transcriptional regulator [Mycolicibacterium senegalense]KLO51679.1 TetR family transcriptional regulator [Mycolicibacterium senegalense]KMV17228.1 TetR family transcriptional regulator [Mycolicibacterium conceptionense]OBK06102.1 TetR family transcriptional regulator [Mycolicibacterium conceptionense]OMB76073.1 TetR family transcriptional regulator [Mycolicibacterium conceptionense]
MTTPTPPAKASAGPVGKDEVVAATLSAAAELFAERGPAATSIRDIATRSKVNHGLIYRHFGTKEQLVGAVLEHLGGRLTALLDGEVSDGEIEQNMDQHMRVMARALLDGYPIGELQTRFPGVNRLLDEVLPRFEDERNGRLAVANAVALQLGWRFFEPFLRSAAGLASISDDEVRTAAGAEIARILQPGAAAD